MLYVFLKQTSLCKSFKKKTKTTNPQTNPTEPNEDLQILIPSRNLPATCGLTLIQIDAGLRILKLSFYYLSSSKSVRFCSLN